MSSKSRKRSPGSIAAAVVVALGAVFITACPGSLADPQDFTGVPADIIGARCATAACHDSKSKAGSIDLTPDVNLRKRIVNVQAPSSSGCTGKLVDTSAPEMSLIYTKCTATPPCGSQMPLTGDSLTQDELDALLMWLSGLK